MTGPNTQARDRLTAGLSGAVAECDATADFRTLSTTVCRLVGAGNEALMRLVNPYGLTFPDAARRFADNLTRADRLAPESATVDDLLGWVTVHHRQASLQRVASLNLTGYMLPWVRAGHGHDGWLYRAAGWKPVDTITRGDGDEAVLRRQAARAGTVLPFPVGGSWDSSPFLDVSPDGVPPRVTPAAHLHTVLSVYGGQHPHRRGSVALRDSIAAVIGAGNGRMLHGRGVDWVSVRPFITWFYYRFGSLMAVDDLLGWLSTTDPGGGLAGGLTVTEQVERWGAVGHARDGWLWGAAGYGPDELAAGNSDGVSLTNGELWSLAVMRGHALPGPVPGEAGGRRHSG